MWSIDIYKGEDALVSIPFNATGYNSFSASFYTTNEVKIERSIEDFVVSGGYLTILFQETDLDILADGVLRYTLKYRIGEFDVIDSSNTRYVIKTSKSYSAATPEDIYMSGYTDGMRAASGGTYVSGYTDGMAAQKAKLVNTAVTANGLYEKEDGYKKVVVNVPQTGITPSGTILITANSIYNVSSFANADVNVNQSGYTEEELEAAFESGITSGITIQKAKLVSTAITSNGTYTKEDGYNSVVVNVQTGITPSGTTNITENGTYNVTNYASANVNVPQTGYTEEELEEAYESGYTAGEDQGFIEGKSAGIEEQKAKLRDGSFDANGVYFRDDGWSEVSVNVPIPVYSSQTKNYSITANGNTNITVDSGYNGITGGTISVNVPSPSIQLQAKSVSLTALSETVTADSGYDGLSQVDIDAKDIYDEGYADAQAAMAPTAITSNGNYSRVDGYSSVSVNVPQTGYTISSADATTQKTVYKVNGEYTYTRPDNISTITEVYNEPNSAVYARNCTNIQIYQIGNKVGVLQELRGCTNLSAITIPESVYLIWKDCFNASGIIEITSLGYYAPSLMNNAFRGISATGTLYYPEGADYSSWLSALGSGWTGITFSRDNAIYFKSLYPIIGHSSQFSANHYYTTSSCGNYRDGKGSLINAVAIQSIHYNDEDTEYNYDVWGFFGTKITEVDIPKTVIYMNSVAFRNCNSLTKIVCNSTVPPTIGIYTFENTNNCPIYVPEESVNAYKTATNWSQYASRIQAIPEI